MLGSDIMYEESQVDSTISAISVIGGNIENNEVNKKLISQFALEDYPDEIRKEAYKYLSIN
jgi:hypothetical protein